MAAIAAVLEAHPSKGQIVLLDDMYFGICLLIKETDIGCCFDFVLIDMRDLDRVRTVVQDKPTGLVWIETPSNPMIRVVDVAAICQIAHEGGALAVVDNTWAHAATAAPARSGARTP